MTSFDILGFTANQTKQINLRYFFDSTIDFRQMSGERDIRLSWENEVQWRNRARGGGNAAKVVGGVHTHSETEVNSNGNESWYGWLKSNFGLSDVTVRLRKVIHDSSWLTYFMRIVSSGCNQETIKARISPNNFEIQVPLHIFKQLNLKPLRC